MTFSPQTVFLTLIGGLLLAGLVAWIRQSSLTVLVPRYFSHSHLTDKGQLVEITVFNRGFKTEEAIELSLNPSLQYNVVGSNSQDVSMLKGKVSINRIGPGDEVTLLLLVEGGAFTMTDITNCLSKETRGKVVTKLEQVMPTGPQRIGLVSALVGIPIFLYSFSVGIDYLLSSRYARIFDSVETAKETTKERTSIDINGWTISPIYESTSHFLLGAFKKGQILISVGKISRKGDVATVSVRFENKTSKVFSVHVSMTTTSSGGRIPSYKRTTDEAIIFPNRSVERQAQVIIPSKTSDSTDHIIFLDAFLQSNDGDTLSMLRSHVVD